MCIVVDANAASKVFKKNNAEHAEFKPVLDWIMTGKGKLVTGGETYLEELVGYLSFFSELNRINKQVSICNKLVDTKKDELIIQINDKKCDDPHIIALLAVSGCKVLCSGDKRSFEYIKTKSFYPDQEIPKIYTSSKNKNLLNDYNLVDICKPCKKLTKKELNNLPNVLK